MEDAFFRYEQARSRILNQSLVQRDQVLRMQVPKELRQQLAELKEQRHLNTQRILSGLLEKGEAASLHQANHQLQDREASLIQTLRQQNPAYAHLVYPQIAGIDTLQSKLRSPEILLSYVMGPTEAHVFVVRPDTFFYQSLGSSERINQAIWAFREQFVQAGMERPEAKHHFQSTSKALYELLIRPIKPHLQGKSLLIIPDGTLHLVPFAALTEQDKAPRHWRELPYLLDEYAISYHASATTLVYQRTRQQTSQSYAYDFIGFGNPIYHDCDSLPGSRKGEGGYLQHRQARNGRFCPLTHSQNEVEGIAALYPQARVQTYFQAEASESQVKSLQEKGELRQTRYLHFAAHGWIDLRYPSLSSIVLSLQDPGGEDGLLQRFECLGLDIRAELVALSACETGLGKVVKGEGMMSFMQSLITAGAQRVLLSQWIVLDQTTADFFQTYYRRLGEGSSPAAALREVQLGFARSEYAHSHPYIWASFSIWGNP